MFSGVVASEEFDLSAYDAGVLTASRELADYFEAVVAKTGDAKLSANWISGELAARLKKNVYQAGGSQDADELYRAFRGQDPSIEPLLEIRGLDQSGP